MALKFLLALVCIILGLVGAVIDQKLLLPTMEWFVLAIAFDLLPFEYAVGRRG